MSKIRKAAEEVMDIHDPVFKELVGHEESEDALCGAINNAARIFEIPKMKFAESWAEVKSDGLWVNARKISLTQKELVKASKAICRDVSQYLERDAKMTLEELLGYVNTF